MLPATAAATPAAPQDTRATLRELRSESILWVLPALYAVSFIFYTLAGRYDNPLAPTIASILSFAIGVAVWMLRRVSYDASAWVLVTGVSGLVVFAVTQLGLGATIVLLALPVGLAALFIGIPGGILAAAGCSVLLLIRATAAESSQELRLLTAIEIWSTVGLIWLAQRPLLTTLEWSWASAMSSLRLLDEARDQRLQNKQALADLAEANVQLARLNQLAQNLRLAAEEARRAKEQFVANVSHELRTPLNMIIGFTEMITQAPHSYGGKIPPALLADLKVVLRNSQHLASLINDVLDLSQIEAGHMSLSKEWVKISEIVEAAVTAVRPLYASKRLYLESDIQDDPDVWCDRTRLREVLLNLLSNAGRFTEHGGVRVSVLGQEQDVVISVADTGPGITPEDHERVFMPFEQLEPSTRRKHGGTGLGLAISKSLVELHGGQIWLESEKGRGSTFFVRIPTGTAAASQGGAVSRLSPDWEYRQRTRRPSVPPPLIRRRLVVVDQGGHWSRQLARHFSDREVVTERSLARVAEELGRQPGQALVLVSTSAPGLDDIELAEGAAALVVHVPPESTVTETLGVADYLVKPVAPQILLAALDRLSPNAKTVLVVDDNPEVQRLTRRVLVSSERGYRVLRAANGQEALDVLSEERPDVILLDLVMPEMDGLRFLERVRQHPTAGDIPIVVLSARDPWNQPIVSSGLTITRGGGLSPAQILACVDFISKIMDTAWRPGDPTQPAGPAG